MEPIFHKDSYGHRPIKSAHDAIGQARKRCWIYDYVIEFDIKGLFDHRIDRNSGTLQGGVISPVFANLFLHYAFDVWMVRANPHAPFERYADDVIIHCKTESEAVEILAKLNHRMKECKLELHPKKTKIIYCKNKDRQK